jgi:DNA-binding transcriptional regulator YiaG
MKADEILALRRRLGLTRERFAKRLRVHVRTVYRWERGDHPPLDRHEVALYRLAQGLVPPEPKP